MDERNGKSYLYEYSRHPNPQSVLVGLMNGVDIELVDPDLFPLIKGLVDTACLQTLESRDTVIHDRLRVAKEYIEVGYEEEMERNRLLAGKKRVKDAKAQDVTRNDIGPEVDRILKGRYRRHYNRTDLVDILNELKVRKQQAIKEERYIESERIGDLINELTRESEFGEVLKSQEERASEMENRAEALRQGGEVLKDRWDAVLESCRAKGKEEIKELKNEKEMELAEISAQKRQPPPARFHKYSAYLKELRRKENALVAAKRFEEASKIQAEADGIQYKEDDKTGFEFRASVDDQIAKANEKWDGLIAKRKMYWKKEADQVIRQRDLELRSAARRLQYLEFAAREAMVPVQALKSARRAKKIVTPSAGSNLPRIGTARPLTVDVERSKSFAERRLLNVRMYSMGLRSGRKES
jgi:hypothetical protein